MSNNDNPLIAGSKPASRTIFPQEIGESQEARTVPAQNSAEPDCRKVKFPQVIRHRKIEAKIYGKTADYPFYRIAYYVGGKRRLRSFPTYGQAKEEAERMVRELASGSQAAALTAGQSRDALAAVERLQAYRQATGRNVSLLAAVCEFVEASSKLDGHTLSEAVERFTATLASVQRKDIAEAVEQFIAADEPRTRATEGQRAQLSAKYAYNRAIQLRRFAGTFPNTAVCDLSKPHLDAFIESLDEYSPKSRNHHRASVCQFLQWSVRKDYLAATNRLDEADGMRPEHANTAEVLIYTPGELAVLLSNAEGAMRAMIAMGGLAGLRTAELLRLDWADVWRVPGHIEVTSGKSKTRQRRLVEVCPALSAWLEPFRALKEARVWPFRETCYHETFPALCLKSEIPRKANGLRHGFCSYHFAAYGNENQTAAQAGNSPAMIHSNYKGLCTRAEAEKWFQVSPQGMAENIVPLSKEA